MTTVQLKIDIYSTMKKGCLYGKAGDVVKVITESVDVLIVEDKKGNRFSVRTEKVLIIN